MAPKVRIGVEYEIFYGVSKALNVGKLVRPGKAVSKRSIGTVIKINRDTGVGFIRGGEHHVEYYFKLTDVAIAGDSFRLGQKVSFEVYAKYGKPRARLVKSAL